MNSIVLWFAERQKRMAALPQAELPHLLQVEGGCVLHGSAVRPSQAFSFSLYRVAIPMSEIRILEPKGYISRSIENADGTTKMDATGRSAEEAVECTHVILAGDVHLTLAHRFKAVEEHLRDYRKRRELIAGSPSL